MSTRYVWAEYSSQGGSFRTYRTNASSSFYPINGTYNGYYYQYIGSDNIDPKVLSYPSTITPNTSFLMTITPSSSNNYGGTINYVYEISRNSATYNTDYMNSNLTNSAVSPSAGTVQWRVYARDTWGFVSSTYIYGPILTISSNFTVTTKVSPVGSGTITGAGTYALGASVTINSTPNTGYKLSNLYRQRENENGATQLGAYSSYIDTVTNNVTYTAEFVKIASYTVSVTVSPSGGGTISGTGSYTSGSSATVKATPAIGYQFSYWLKSGSQVSSSESYTFTVNSDVSLTAVFTKVNYTVSVGASPTAGGTVTGEGSYGSGSSVTVKATSNTGYTFSRWVKDGTQVSTSTAYTFIISSNTTLTAYFTANTYTISAAVSPTGGGTISGTGNYSYNSTATLTATASSGYKFSHWLSDGSQVSTSAKYSFTVAGSKSFTAVFVKTYTVSVSASPTSGGTVSGGGTFNSGTSITVKATTKAGYIFTGWYENNSRVSNNASYTFIISANRTLVAKFELEDSSKIYFGVAETARKVKDIYIGINGKARRVVKAYIGIDSKARRLL